MKDRYELVFTAGFLRDLKKQLKHNKVLKITVQKVLNILMDDPFDQRLRTHKVATTKYGWQYSSRVTGDYRLIWNFNNDGFIIVMLAFGGHAGTNAVY